MSELFRSEALEDRRTLLGDVSLAVPVRSSLILAVMGLLFVVIVGFLAFGSIHRRVSAMGWLRPSGPITQVYARGDWLIGHVFVSEGSFVRKGAPLLEASDLASTSGDQQAQTNVLKALSDEDSDLKDELLSTQRKFELDQARSESELGGKVGELKQLEHDIALQSERGRVVEQTLKDVRLLASRGYVSKLQLRQYQDDALDTQQKLAVLRQERATLEADVQSLRSEPARLRAQLDANLSNLRQRSAQLTQRRLQAQAADRFILRAPADGQVADVQVRPGEISRRDQFQLAIIPAKTFITAELFVPSSGVGLLRPGQTVHVRYDAYPYQQFGYGAATVSSISRTSIRADEAPIRLGTNEPVYRVALKLVQPRQLSRDFRGRDLELRSGMTLSADILLEQQPLWRAFLPSSSVQ